MHPAIEITALHLGLAAVWIPPARRLMPEVHPAAAASLGYLLGATLLLAIHHVLNFAGVHSAPLAWLGCAAAWIVLMRTTPAAPRLSSPRIRRDCLCMAALTLGGAGLRLADSLRHDSLAGGDSYLLLQYVHRFIDQGVVFHEYIAGIPVLLGSLRIRATPFDVLHFGPALLSALGVPAFFALGWALGGRKAGWLSAIGLAGCFGFLHVVSFNLVFVQFSTLCLALPWLILLTPEALRTGSARVTALLAGIWLFLILTGTYFALILACAAGVWVIGVRLARAISTPVMFRGLLMLALVPAWIAFHYAVAAPVRNPQSGATFGNQVKEFEKIERNQAPSSPPSPGVGPRTASPAVRSVLLFAAPKRLELFRPSTAESVFIWILAAAAIGLLRAPFSVRGFTGVLMIFAMLGTVTGMFEMPGYQGRYLYLLMLMGLPVVASLLIRAAPWMLRWTGRHLPPARHLFRWKVIASGALLACIPSVVLPPEAGKTIPIAPGLIVRCDPEDDILTRLAFSATGGRPLQMVFLFPPGVYSYAGAAVSGLNRKEAVAAVDITRRTCTGIPADLPRAAPGGAVVLIMPRDMWDGAPPEVRSGISPGAPARLVLMTPRTVAVFVGPDLPPEGLPRSPEQP